MATQVADLKMSLAEFLEWDDGTDARFELIDGQVVAMAPPSPRHGALTARLTRLVGNALTPPCEIFVEAGIVASEQADTWLQADLAISCRPLDEHGRYLAEPILIVEVESPATVRHDRGVKIDRYREIASVREIVLISSVERRCQVWRREVGRWTVEDVIGDATLRLHTCPLAIPLLDLYVGL
jgi:Uma2 family endonuclease